MANKPEAAQDSPEGLEQVQHKEILHLMSTVQDLARQRDYALRRATEAETELQALALIRGVNHLLGEPPPTLEEYLEMHRRTTEAEGRVAELQKQLEALTPPRTTEGR